MICFRKVGQVNSFYSKFLFFLDYVIRNSGAIVNIEYT